MTFDAKRAADWLLELVNNGNMALVDETVAPEFVRHDLGGWPDIKGPEGVKMFITGLRTAFPDLQMTIEDVIAGGNKVVIQYTMRGTHNGPLWSIQPTGREVTWAGINIYRLEGNKVAETWQLTDSLGLVRQLGIVPQR